jgi:hypothetical protein
MISGIYIRVRGFAERANRSAARSALSGSLLSNLELIAALGFQPG